MSRIETGQAVLTITCTVWARIHHHRTGRQDGPGCPTKTPRLGPGTGIATTRKEAQP